MNTSINNYKREFNNVANKASKSTLTDYLPIAQLKQVGDFGKKINKKVRVQIESASKGIHNVVNTNLGNTIIHVAIFGILLLAIGFLSFYYNKLKNTLKYALKYLIMAIITLLISMYGVYIVLPKSSTIAQIISILLVGLSSYLLILSTVNTINYLKSFKIDSPWIIEGSKNGKNSIVVPQDPDNLDTVMLYRSENQQSGIEFSYSFWIIIQDYNYNTKGEYKHIFHKGDKSGKNTYCPKVFLKNDTNTLSIVLNLIDNTDSPNIDIENIPLNKWVHVSLVVKQRLLEIFINGNLKKNYELKAIPRQNFNDLWVNLDGGFEGFLSKFQYHRRALAFDEVESMVNSGPSDDACSVTGIKPPYLDSNWWLDRDSNASL